MTWGNPFRNAWRRSTPSGQAAAREAALNPEQAAGILSQKAVHQLKLVQFAAQDMQRLAVSRNARDAQPSEPGSTAVRRAMDAIRQGRISPEESEQHLRQAARAAVGEAEAGQQPMTKDELAMNRERQLAASRFNDLRSRLLSEMDETNQRLRTSGSNAANAIGEENRLKLNLEFADRLIQAHIRIDHIFLSNKSVDDPVAPVPPPAEDNQPNAGVPCQPPRA